MILHWFAVSDFCCSSRFNMAYTPYAIAAKPTTVAFIAGSWRAKPAPRPPMAARPDGWPGRLAARVRR
jgi:hypothetical protein